MNRRHAGPAVALGFFSFVVMLLACVMEALGVLGASALGEVPVHNRWTTHGTWERGVRRIQEKSARVERSASISVPARPATTSA